MPVVPDTAFVSAVVSGEHLPGGSPEDAAAATNATGPAAGGTIARAANGPLSAEPARSADASAPGTFAGNLDTGDLGLIDLELAEHQRWAAASGRVGEVASIERAAFISEAVGGGFIEGVATGAAMGLGIGVVTRAVPLIGPIIGGSMALHGLLTRDWAATGETIGRFGEGSDSYETLANSLASVSAVIDVVSGILGVINGIVGVVQLVAIGVAAGAGVLAFFTFGATAGIAIAAGELALTCEEISEGINLVTMVLDGVNAALLNPCITLFRALHAFTTQADPREVETSGQALSAAASASGSALGGWIGGRTAQAGGRPRPPHDDAAPATARAPHDAPPAAAGDGPEVHFQPAPTEGVLPARAVPELPTSTRPSVEDIAASLGRRIADDQATPATGNTVPPTTQAGPAAAASNRRSARVAPSEESFADAGFDTVLRDLRNSPLGHELEASQRRAPEALPTDTTRTRAQVDAVAHREARQATPPGRVPGAQVQHDTKTLDVTRNLPPGMDPLHPDVINENLRWLQSRRALPATEMLVDPHGGGTRYYVDDLPRGGFGDAGARGEQFDLFNAAGPARPPDYSAEHKFADASLIPRSSADIAIARERVGQQPLDPRMQAIAAGEYARWRTSGDSGTQRSGRTLNLAAQTSSRADTPVPARAAAESPQLDLFGARTSPDTPLRVGEGSTRSSAPLTQAQYEQNAAMAVEMGMPADQIHQAQGDTSYHPGYDALLIGADVNPLPAPQRPTGLANPANAALDPRAVIGHEVIGHREAALGGQTRDEVWHEELQASARAAIHTPELSHEQSWALLQDAAARRRFQTREGEIHIDTERYGPAAQSRAPGPAAPGTHSGDPSVVVDWNAVGARPSNAGPALALESTSAPPVPGSSSTAAGSALAASRSPTAPVATPTTPGASAGSSAGVTVAAAGDALAGDAAAPAAGVEHVSPHYTAPPATPAEIVAIQNEILNLLAVRARAEREVEHQDERVAASEANRAPISRTAADTRAGLAVVAAHEAAVARRDAANQEQQRRQQEAAGLTAGYPNRATGLTALAVPLSAWESFTSLASHLPGDAGDRMAEMNQQARAMQSAFDHMGARMLGVDGDQPTRAGALAGDAARLDATGAQAQTSDQRLQSADEGAAGLHEANEATLAQAQGRSAAASARSQSLADAANQREQQASSLAAQLRAWAARHRGERTAAVDATVRQLEAEGNLVTQATPE